MVSRRSLLILLLLVFLATSLLSAERSAREMTVSGTGFVVGANGYILTNEHVIHETTDVKITIGGQEYSAYVVEARAERDLALLKAPASGLPTVSLGDSDTVKIGDQVVAIGCPEGICGTTTLGRVANLGVDATFGDRTLHNLIMIDVTITHGSSGGPLLNMKGEVIGVTMGGIEGTRFGFAIPINDAISLLEWVPGFSRSQMGQATQELTLSEIVERVGPAVAYMKAERLIPLERLLPAEEEINRIIGWEAGDLWKRSGFSLRAGCQVEEAVGYGIAPLTGYWSGNPFPDWFYAVFDLPTNTIATELQARFIRELRDSVDFTPHCGGCDFPGEVPRCAVEDYIQETKQFQGVPVYFGFKIGKSWFCEKYCTYDLSGLCYGCDYDACMQREPQKALEGGFASWIIGDLLFAISIPFGPFHGEAALDIGIPRVVTLAQVGVLHALEVMQNPQR